MLQLEQRHLLLEKGQLATWEANAYALISQRPVKPKYAPASTETGTSTTVAPVTAYAQGKGTTSSCCEEKQN
jgi:hypothetical protein